MVALLPRLAAVLAAVQAVRAAPGNNGTLPRSSASSVLVEAVHAATSTEAPALPTPTPPPARASAVPGRQGGARVMLMDQTPQFPFDPNTPLPCTWWHDNDGSITCANMAFEWDISQADFLRWNPSITSTCGNFLLERSYCVEGPPGGSPPPATTTKATTTSAPAPGGNGIETPTPIQPGMVSNCNAFATVRPTTTCQGILDWNKITLANFVKWNPAVGPSCTNLWTNTWACIGVISDTPPPATTTRPPGNGIETPTPIQAGMVSNCNAFATVRPTTTCQGIMDWNKISLADFVKWNPAVGPSCGNLWANTWACIGVIGGSPPPATTTKPPGNGIETPTPIQAGMVSNCNAFATVRPTTTCQGILDWNKISLANFVKWNPAVGPSCGNLWANTWACIGVIGGSPPPAATTTKAPGNGIETPTPVQAGMVSNCNAFATVRPTTTCQGILDWNKISLADFVKWNPAVGASCGNLWANTWACIGVIGGSGGGGGGGGGNGITTPQPIQAGMVTSCTKFHNIRPTTTCQGVLDYNKITLQDFVKWNPAVGAGCGNLWANTYACIGVQ